MADGLELEARLEITRPAQARAAGAGRGAVGDDTADVAMAAASTALGHAHIAAAAIDGNLEGEAVCTVGKERR